MVVVRIVVAASSCPPLLPLFGPCLWARRGWGVSGCPSPRAGPVFGVWGWRSLALPCGGAETVWGVGAGVGGGWCGVGPLVPVGSRAPRGASTSGLSTRCSGGGLSPHVGAWKPHLGAGFPLRCFQRLSFPNVANQPCTWRYNWHTRGSSIPVLSYWGRPSIKFPARAEDRDRTVSRRSEPSSRTALMGEQPNPWDLLQPQDATSRHRGAKPCRRYGLLGKISLLSPGYLLSVERPRTHVPWPDH